MIDKSVEYEEMRLKMKEQFPKPCKEKGFFCGGREGNNGLARHTRCC